MEVTTTQLKRCDLVKATGRIDSQTAPRLTEALEAITNGGRFKIVFDMSGVEFISSAGLRAMINTQKTCKRWNRGQMLLAGVSPRIHDAMKLVGFVPLFEFYDDASEAVGSF
jgi:anti-sigma B factor antagonist